MVSHTNLRLPGTVQGRWLLSCCKRTSVYSQYSFFFSNVIFVEAVVRMYIPPFPSPLGSEQPFSSVILFCFCNLLYVMGVLTRFLMFWQYKSVFSWAYIPALLRKRTSVGALPLRKRLGTLHFSSTPSGR